MDNIEKLEPLKIGSIMVVVIDQGEKPEITCAGKVVGFDDDGFPIVVIQSRRIKHVKV